MWTVPSGHSSELNTIFNDVVNFTIGETLGCAGAEIRGTRIQTPTD